jgi:trafficking protein particle complex subunit 9
VSSLPVGSFSLYFDDSTKAAAQQALADGDLSVFDAYETEYDLINRPMFSWQNQAENNVISPGQAITVAVTCLGKVGW